MCSRTCANLNFKILQLHKAWLERRSGLSRNRDFPVRNETEARITYLRKLIKFKNAREPAPLSENDVAFVPDFRTEDATINVTTEVPQPATPPKTSTAEATTFTESAPNYAASTEAPITLTTTHQPEDETLEKVGVSTLEPPTTTTTDAIRADEIVMKSVFTSWSNWTSCSRSCGGGVKSQIRKCVKRS